MSELSGPIVGAIISAVATIIAAIIIAKAGKATAPEAGSTRRRTWGWIVLSVAALAFCGSATWFGISFFKNRGGERSFEPRGGSSSAPGECEPSGFLIGLKVETTLGPEKVTGKVAECELLIARAEDKSWGIGLRPVVHVESGESPNRLVRIDAFEVTNPGDSQQFSRISSIGVREGSTGAIQSPDRGSLLVTVTSISEQGPGR